jgi:hypothetical protein
VIKKVLLIITVLFIGSSVAFFVFVILPRFNAPAKGTLLNTSVLKDTVANRSVFDFTPIVASGPLVSFNHPASLQTAKSSRLVNPVVEKHDFIYRDVETWLLAIEVLHIPSGKLSDNGSYTFCKTYSNIYQESEVTYNGHPIIVMSDKTVGGFKKIAFLVHGQYQAEISLYGNDVGGEAKLQTTFDMIINTWHWLVG